MQARVDHPIGRAAAELVIAVRPEYPAWAEAARKLEAELARLAAAADPR